jgi:negative regulator of flagellin synthesis FlgM
MDIKQVLSYTAGNVQNPGSPTSKAGGEDKGTSAAGAASDRVELSKDYQDLIQAKKTMVANNEVRPEKVERIQKQLDNGTYQVNPESVAAKMMEEIF